MTHHMDEICALCGEDYGQHNGPKCRVDGVWSDTQKFIKRGELILQDCKVGWMVALSDPYSRVIGMVLGERNGEILLGWIDQPDEIEYWVYNGCSVSTQKMMHMGGIKYSYAWWYHSSTRVDQVVSMRAVPTITAVAIPSGMNCANKFCNSWNDYAVANQTNGTYLCYSCAQGGHTSSV